MQKKIHKILNELGVPFASVGREMLAYAIETVYENGRVETINELYTIIGERFNSSYENTVQRIKRVIKKSSENANREVVNRIFGNTVSKSGKLTNMDFIYGVVEYLKIYG